MLPAVVAAALVVTSLGVVGAAVAETTAPPAATSISIRALRPTIQPSQTTSVAGNINVEGASPAGRLVALEARATGEEDFTPIGTATSGARGGLLLDVRPEVTTRYRWSYAGAEDARPRVSGVAVVRVRTGEHPARRLPTTLSIRAMRPMVDPGERGIVRGTLRSRTKELRGKYVVLLSRKSPQGGWKYRSGHRTARDGSVRFAVRPQRRTAYQLAYAGGRSFRPVKSGVVQIGVLQSVTISAAPRRLDPGASTVIAATATHAGSAVAGATAELVARADRRGQPWAVVGTASTAFDGSVSFTATPAEDTRYRVRVLPAAGLPGGRSPVILVDVRSASTLSIRGVDAEDGFVVRGQLRAEGRPVRNAPVTLQTRDSATSTWTDTATARTSRTGVVRFLRPSSPGGDYRLVYTGPRFAQSTSATLTD